MKQATPFGDFVGGKKGRWVAVCVGALDHRPRPCASGTAPPASQSSGPAGGSAEGDSTARAAPRLAMAPETDRTTYASRRSGAGRNDLAEAAKSTSSGTPRRGTRLASGSCGCAGDACRGGTVVASRTRLTEARREGGGAAAPSMPGDASAATAPCCCCSLHAPAERAATRP